MSKYTRSSNYFEDKLKSLKRYTTRQEKEFLLLEDDVTYTERLRVLSDVKPLNEYEAIALMFKLREISVSNIIELQKRCSCGSTNLYQINTAEFFNFNPEPISGFEDLPVGLFFGLDDVINTKITDDMIIRDYNKLEKDLLDRSVKIFKLNTTKICQKCGNDIVIDINPVHIMSKSNPASIYKEYLNISFYTNNSKLCIDSMYPFEREIYIGLLNEKLEQEPNMNF